MLRTGLDKFCVHEVFSLFSLSLQLVMVKTNLVPRDMWVSCVLSRTVKTCTVMFTRALMFCSHLLYKLKPLRSADMRQTEAVPHAAPARCVCPLPARPLHPGRPFGVTVCMPSHPSPPAVFLIFLLLWFVKLTPCSTHRSEMPTQKGPDMSSTLSVLPDAPRVVCVLPVCTYGFQFHGFNCDLFLLKCFFSLECLFQQG